MATYLFSMGVLPVQEWIRQARRSRDVRAGSVVLCHVMARLLQRLEAAGARVLVPALPEKGTLARLAAFPAALGIDYGIPHRASGLLEARDDDAVRQVFSSLESEVVEAAWGSLRQAYLHYPPTLRQDDDDAVWAALEPELHRRRQSPGSTDCPFSLVWVALPAPPGAAEAPDLGPIDRLYADVKRSRPYRVTAGGVAVAKCSLCGVREALGPGPADFDGWHRQLAAQPSLLRGRRFEAGERLCAVCWTRRMSGYAERHRPFPSTGEVASAAWCESLRRAGQGEALDALLRAGRGEGDDPSEAPDSSTALYSSPRLLRERHPETARAILAAREHLEILSSLQRSTGWNLVSKSRRCCHRFQQEATDYPPWMMFASQSLLLHKDVQEVMPLLEGEAPNLGAYVH